MEKSILLILSIHVRYVPASMGIELIQPNPTTPFSSGAGWKVIMPQNCSSTRRPTFFTIRALEFSWLIANPA